MARRNKKQEHKRLEKKKINRRLAYLERAAKYASPPKSPVYVTKSGLTVVDTK